MEKGKDYCANSATCPEYDFYREGMCEAGIDAERGIEPFADWVASGACKGILCNDFIMDNNIKEIK